MPRCYLALGGNQGRVAETFDRALRALADTPEIAVADVSRFMETQPVGHDQPRFLNAVASVDTTLPPGEVLTLLQRIEADLGRIRERRWGARTLDLDLILFGDTVIETPRLTVPHPACWYRRFVLDPLVEISPGAFHPVKKLTAGELRGRLLVRPFEMSIAGEPPTGRVSELIQRLQAEFPDVRISQWSRDAAPPVSGFEPAIVAWFGGHGPEAVAWSDLPNAARLDATGSTEPPGVFLRHVLQAALNC